MEETNARTHGEINIPALGDVETVVKLYWEKIDLRNADIKAIFPGIGDSTVQKLKRVARAYTAAAGRMQINSRTVLTEDAYIAWGLDISVLEKRCAKLQKMKGAKQR